MNKLEEKLFLVGVLNVMSDIFFDVLEKRENSYEVMCELITDKDIRAQYANLSHFSGDIIHEICYEYTEKVKNEITQEIFRTTSVE